MKKLTTSLMVAGVLGILVVSFQNFTFATWERNTVFPLNETKRVAHAKELLGSDYKKSFASKLEGDKDLNKVLFDKVQKSLPNRYKAQASQVTNTIIKEAARYNMDPFFVIAVIKTESNWNPLVRGRHGEIGLMQIKPSTAQWMSQKYKIAYNGPMTLENPSANIRLATAYMNHLRKNFKDKPQNYVNAYNMGPLNMRRLIKQNIKADLYSSKVLNNYKAAYKNVASSSISPLVAVR